MNQERVMIAVDIDRGLWVDEGKPEIVDGIPEIPNVPLTFTADKLIINDADHKNLILSNIQVVLGHAHRVNGEWQFFNGQSVVQTVRSFNSLHPGKKIEFVIACNHPDPGQMAEINISDFSIFDNVASSGNEPVHFSVIKEKDGKLLIYVSISGKFFGVEELNSRKMNVD